MTPQQLEYLRQQYGGGGSLPPPASLEEEPTTAPYDPRFERPNLPPPPNTGAQVEMPGQNTGGGPGTFNDQFPLPRGGYPDIWDQPPTIGGNLPPSPDFTPSDRYLPSDYGPATVMQPSPARYDFTGGPDLYGQTPVAPYGPTGPPAAPQYDFSGGPNVFAGSPTVPTVGEMPGGYNPPLMESGGFPTSDQYYDYGQSSPEVADTGGGQPLTEGEPDFGGFPVGGGDTGGYDNTGGVALTEGEPDFGGTPIQDAGYTPTSEDIAAFNQDPLAGSNWPYYINEFPGGGEAPPADTGGGGSPGMTGSQASGGAPYGYPGPGIGGPNQAGPWVEHNTAPWYPGRPDITTSADRNVYGTPPQGGFHPGQMIKDAAGNVIDSTGKIVMTAAQAFGKLPGQISDALGRFGNNIMNDPRNTTPDYLASMNYHEMNTGEMVPFGVTGATIGSADIGAYGAGGGGGSYFHGGASAGNQHAAGPLPGANLGGAGGGSIANAAALGGGALWKQYLMRMQKGLYNPYTIGKYPAPALIQAGMSIPGAVQTTPGSYRQGQMSIHTMLQDHPEWFQAVLGRGGGRQGQGPLTNAPANQRGNVKTA